MPRSICTRSTLPCRSTHFRYGSRRVDLGVQDFSYVLVFLVICKEEFPVIQCLLVSKVTRDDKLDLPSFPEDRNLVYRGLGVFRSIPSRMIVRHLFQPYRISKVSRMSDRGLTSCYNYPPSHISSYLPKHHKPPHPQRHKLVSAYYSHRT